MSISTFFGSLRRQALGLRRMLGMLAAASVVLASAESALPDVHQSAVRGVDQAVLTCAHGAVSCQQDSTPSRSNSSHVDHCAHGHVVALPLELAVESQPEDVRDLPIQPAAGARNVARPPLARPPIV